MGEYAGGFLEVGSTGDGQVVINHPDLKPDENGVGHIIFSVDEARNLAHLLNMKANQALSELQTMKEKQRREQQEKSVPRVDKSKRCMLSGNPETTDHKEINPSTGMQKDYVVLCPEERSKGFVRPVRRTYRHLPCNTTTTMGIALAETYARDPYFYSGTFCCSCRAHFPLDEFVWEGTDEKVGT